MISAVAAALPQRCCGIGSRTRKTVAPLRRRQRPPVGAGAERNKSALRLRHLSFVDDDRNIVIKRDAIASVEARVVFRVSGHDARRGAEEEDELLVALEGGGLASSAFAGGRGGGGPDGLLLQRPREPEVAHHPRENVPRVRRREVPRHRPAGRHHLRLRIGGDLHWLRVVLRPRPLNGCAALKDWDSLVE